MLLAVDTSTRWVGLALYDGAQVISEAVWQSQGHHTSEVAPVLATLMERAGARPENLVALGVALGPGSFTSLRIGLGLVKGLALALHLPIVGIPSLDILAAAQPLRDIPMIAALQIGRSRLAIGRYEVKRGAWTSLEPAVVMRIDELAADIHHPTLVCGELNAEERQLLARKRRNVVLASPAACLRRPSYLAESAWRAWRAGKTADPVTLAPIYLSASEAIPA